MASAELQWVLQAIQARPAPSEDAAMDERRAGLEEFMTSFASPVGDARIEPISAGGVPSEWVTVQGVDPARTILYLHGGAYVLGSPASHRVVTIRLARAATARVLAPDYRLAPEHPFPAAVEDAVSAYRWLLDAGTPSAQIVIAGDSAGGGLTLATLLSLRETGLELPAAGVLISPWADLACESESYLTNLDTDPMIDQEGLTGLSQMYLAGQDAAEPLASPVHADLTGLPPLLIQVGEAEKLLDDATRLTDRARDAGVDVTLERWPDMPHVWHLFADRLPEGEQAIEAVATFVVNQTPAMD